MSAELTTEERNCPRCSSPMVLRVAARGQFLGQQFWGCSTYPACRALINVSAEPTATAQPETERAFEAGTSAQAEFDRRRRRHAERVRNAWPAFVGITLVAMLMIYLVVLGPAGPLWAGAAAAGVAVLFIGPFLQLPQATDAWRIGAEGERATARHLRGLEAAGFIVLHDRKAGGYRGNIDHIAIGPSGVWAIESKSLSGKVEIHGDSLRIGGRRRDKILDQVYREATVVKDAMGASASALGLTVTPVICLHRAELPFFNKTVRGVRLASGRQLVRLLRDADQRLTAKQVEALAREADQLFRPAGGE